VAQLRQGIGIWEATGSALLQPFLHYLLADALKVAGDVAGALSEADLAIAIAERTGEKWFHDRIVRLRDELRAHG
jgi:predicted ATPase